MMNLMLSSASSKVLNVLLMKSKLIENVIINGVFNLQLHYQFPVPEFFAN